MKTLRVDFTKKGQLKIQQMAFVLVALLILFAMVALFYFSVSYSNLKEDVEGLREDEVIETVRKMAGTAEFSWGGAGDCSSCIDFDKALALKNRNSYDGFWKNIAFLQIARVHPTYEQTECTAQTYPECDTLTFIEEETTLRGHKAFVSLCYYEHTEGYNKCELGKIVMAFETIE